jgi:hypothetical protein
MSKCMLTSFRGLLDPPPLIFSCRRPISTINVHRRVNYRSFFDEYLLSWCFFVLFRYKKFRDAKALTLSGQSLADKQAIFGHAIQLTGSDTVVSTGLESEQKRDKKKDKKRKRSESDDA